MKLYSRLLVLIGHCLPESSLLAYALDGLQGVEREQAKAHLLGCPHCQERLREHWELADALAAASSAVAAPEGLALKVLARVGAKKDGPQGLP